MAGEELTENDGVGVGNNVDPTVGWEGINVGSEVGIEGSAVGSTEGKNEVEGLSDGDGPKLKPVGNEQYGY